MAMDDFDLSSFSPIKTSGLDPDDPRSLRLFANLQGGGVGEPTSDNPAAPAGPAISRRTAPNPAPVTVPGGVAPAAVSPSGDANASAVAPASSGSPWAPWVQKGLEAQERNLQQAEKTQEQYPDVTQENQREQAAFEKQQADVSKLASDLRVTDPNSPDRGKLLPEYRPTAGQRVKRGLQAFARGGLRGVLDANYGAPNRAGQQELRAEQGAVAADQATLGELRKRFEDTTGRLKAQSTEERANATAAADIAKGATAQETAENKGTLEHAQMLLDTAKAGWGNGKTPTTAEGIVAKAALEMYPNDPKAQVKFVRDNQFVDANTAARMAEAQAAHAQTLAAAQANHDNALMARENQAYMQYQTQLAQHGTKVAALTQSATDRWKKFQDDFDNEFYGKVDPSSGERTGGVSEKKDSDPDKQRVLNKYNADKASLQNAIKAEFDAEPTPKPPPAYADYLAGNAQAPTLPNRGGSTVPAAVSPSGTAQPVRTPPQRQTPQNNPQARAARPGTVIGPAPQGSREGRTGRLPDGTPVVVKGGKLVVRG